MKKALFVIFGMLLCVNVFAAKKTAVLTPEQEADKMFAQRNTVTDTAKAVENADKTIAVFKKVYDAAPTDERLVKLIKAVDFRNYNLPRDTEARKQAYKELLASADKLCEGNTACANSKYIAYAYMTLWGRYGDIIDVLEAATSGIAGKVKDHSEKLMTLDKRYHDGAALLALGRLHWKAPNIIFVLTWPDKNIGRKNLEEYVAGNPGGLLGKLYLADALWDTNDQEKAKVMYKEVMNAKPRSDYYFEDLKAKDLCAARVKEQGIQE